MKKVVRSGDCVGGGRVPGSRQWCTNFSEVCGPSSIQNGWTKVNCQRNENNRRWRRPYDVLAEATHGEIVVRMYDQELLGAILRVIDPLLSWWESVGRVRAEEVENAEVNSKYQDKAKGQRPKDFIRSVSTSFSQRYPKVGDFKLMQECSTKDQSMQYVVLYLFDSEE
ncbi:hypothetical protein BHE74_00013127 [Ensete ventricosum]|nr:hypothetical protein BHE74_00013127 [Ensete ventricosum]